MNKTQQKLFDITIEWNDLEDSMGENAALEVACSQNGKTSQWYYDNMFEHHEVVNPELRKF